MKTVTVSARSKTLNDLLDMAQDSDVILERADGSQFLLTNVTEALDFDVGDSDDFDEEIKATRKNKKLMKFLDKRRAKAKAQKGTPIANVKKQLGI
jgi:hypothetical protein